MIRDLGISSHTEATFLDISLKPFFLCITNLLHTKNGFAKVFQNFARSENNFVRLSKYL